jgi:hypothetical protein
VEGQRTIGIRSDNSTFGIVPNKDNHSVLDRVDNGKSTTIVNEIHVGNRLARFRETRRGTYGVIEWRELGFQEAPAERFQIGIGNF